MKNIIIIALVVFGLGWESGVYAQPYNIVWTDIVGANATGSTLTKNTTIGWGNSGGASSNVLTAGVDGWANYVALVTNEKRMFGLSDSNADANYTTIAYAINLRDLGDIRVFENGIHRGDFGNYSANDVFEIERIGTTITYKRNSIVFYTSTVPSTTDLIVDVSLYTSNAAISNGQASFDIPGGGAGNGNGNGGGGNNNGGGGVWTASGDNIYYNTGNVTVGDTTDNGRLYVKNDSTGLNGMVINQTVNTDTTSALKLEVEGNSSKALIIEAAGTTQFQINGNGKAYAREVEVTLNPFPDYVFEKDYQLMPLDQLKIFIEKNKHLPNVRTGKDIDQNGIGLGDLSHKQMEKIEELTLYILQMNERLNKLEEENKKLKAEISKIK